MDLKNHKGTINSPSGCFPVLRYSGTEALILIVIAAVGIFLTWRTDDAMVGKLPPE